MHVWDNPCIMMIFKAFRKNFDVTSGTEPRFNPTTGVPHAIDSIMTSPKGSDPMLVKINARALPRKWLERDENSLEVNCFDNIFMFNFSYISHNRFFVSKLRMVQNQQLIDWPTFSLCHPALRYIQSVPRACQCWVSAFPPNMFGLALFRPTSKEFQTRAKFEWPSRGPFPPQVDPKKLNKDVVRFRHRALGWRSTDPGEFHGKRCRQIWAEGKIRIFYRIFILPKKNFCN